MVAQMNQNLEKIRTAGEKMKQQSASIGTVLKQLDEFFSTVSLPAEILDKKSFHDCKGFDANGEQVFTIYDLSYGPSDEGQWGLCVRSYKHREETSGEETETKSPSSELELESVELLSQAPLEVQLKALTRLGPFIEALSTELEKQCAEVEKLTAQFEKLPTSQAAQTSQSAHGTSSTQKETATSSKESDSAKKKS